MTTSLMCAFGPIVINGSERILLNSGEPVVIQPQTFQVLYVLAKNLNQFVSKAELLTEAWPDEKYDNSDSHNARLRFQVHLLNTMLKQILVSEDMERIKIVSRKKIGYKLQVDPSIVISSYPTNVSEADKLYEEGRFHWQNSTAKTVVKAIDFFQRAVSVDPAHANAYSGLADSWVLAGTFGHQSVAPHIAMEKAREAAYRALDLNDRLGEAYAAVASVQALYDWDWQKAGESFEKAIRFSSNPMIRAWYSLCLAGRGEHESAQIYLSEAIERNRSNFLLRALMGRVYYLARDFDKSVKTCEEAIELQEHFYLSYLFMGHALRAQGRIAEALGAFTKCSDLGFQHPTLIAEEGNTQARMGQESAALKRLDELTKPSEDSYVSPHCLFSIWVGLGNKEKALEHLQQTLADRGAYLIFLTTDPIYDELRQEPVFQSILRSVPFARD